MNFEVPSGILTLIIGLGSRLGLAVVAAIAGSMGYISFPKWLIDLYLIFRCSVT